MRRHRAPWLAGGLLLALAGCTATPKAPPHPVVQAAAPPTMVVPPTVADWQDVPLTPGAWRYAPAADGSSASYGPAATSLLTMRCDLARRRVVFTITAAGPLTLRTSSSSRTLPLDVEGAASLPARDPFLDEVAFSRGRFSISAPGMETLFIPAWAEPSRVIEDCRG